MKIAVLAWGSLLWSPRELKIDESHWHSDGPFLPVEFSRIASDGRLTLVIDPGFDDVQTYWHLMDVENLEEARRNLQLREGADSINEIGFVEVGSSAFQIRQDILHLKERIKKWASGKSIDAVIWTDLQPKFKEKTGNKFSLHTAVMYLESLDGYALERSKEYILMAPENTVTRYREALENCFNKKSP